MTEHDAFVRYRGRLEGQPWKRRPETDVWNILRARKAGTYFLIYHPAHLLGGKRTLPAQGSQSCKSLVYSLALHRTTCRRRKRCDFETILRHTICIDSTSIVRVFKDAFKTFFRVYIYLLCAYLKIFVDYLCNYNCN